ncbi:MAG: 1-(5-phosphoribosyl)-5-[(5-phosphoribosylamino)methylideneamino] imidazole-4-carboxamide isomerase [Anaerolineae bacterium]|nr:1-(5-phosphoribosyl)-5-[(5-phosphoribosylamino)methylideneamino] imidazole-4-carboxamide isomerase [Anaerolineae bacterium]
MSNFTVFPAIDLRRGKVVRLLRGDPACQTTYSDDPASIAARWLEEGARWLHVVNLDGAFGEEEHPNLLALDAILKMARAYCPPRFVQFGGGVRTLAMIEQVLQTGVERVVLGTMAATSADLAAEAVKCFGSGRVAAALDIRAGRVAVEGWRSTLSSSAEELGRSLCAAGVETLIYTDISRDGTQTGCNVVAAVALASATQGRVILSGGVSSLSDISAARRADLAGVIVGRALYEGCFRLSQALEDCDAGKTHYSLSGC